MYDEFNNDYRYYENYLLDDMDVWELTEKNKEILNMAIWIVDNRCSIQQCSKEFGKSKSQLHRDIHQKLRNISYELYQCVLSQLKTNKRRYFK